MGWYSGRARPADIDSRYFLYRCRAAGLQHSAYLSSRWRPDSSRRCLWFVMGRARSLMVATILGFVGIAAFIGLAFWSRDLLARSNRRFHAHELLERTAARASPVALREVAAPRWLYLSGMQEPVRRSATYWKCGKLRPGLRYFSDARQCARTARLNMRSPSAWIAAPRIP